MLWSPKFWINNIKYPRIQHGIHHVPCMAFRKLFIVFIFKSHQTSTYESYYFLPSRLFLQPFPTSHSCSHQTSHSWSSWTILTGWIMRWVRLNHEPLPTLIAHKVCSQWMFNEQTSITWRFVRLSKGCQRKQCGHVYLAIHQQYTTWIYTSLRNTNLSNKLKK